MTGRLTFAAAAGASAGSAGLNAQHEPLSVSFDPSAIAPRIAETQESSFSNALVLGSERYRPSLAIPTENNDPRPLPYRPPAKLSLVWPPQKEVAPEPEPPRTDPSTAGFVVDSPQAQPTAVGGSSAPVYETAGFPLYPVWLPALFSLAKRKVSLNAADGKYPGTIPTQPRSGDPMGADGPSFSGMLARPAPREPYCDFNDKKLSFDPMPPLPSKSAEPAKPATPQSNARDIAFAAPGKSLLRGDTFIRFWRTAPVLIRGLVLAAPVIFTVLYFGPKVEMPESSSPEATPGPSSLTSIREAAKARATVDLREDFRQGPDRWLIKPGRAGAWSFDGEGSAKPGRLGIFQETIPLKNYRFEFLGQIDTKAMSFVFRAPDTDNYQAVKLVVVKPGAVPTLAMVRYTVINGKAGPKVQTPLPIEGPRRDTIYKLLVDVQGDNFTVSVNGQLVNGWSDTRLKSGGIGFFADRGESARVRSLHVIDHQDFLGWLCSQVSWWTADRQKSGVAHE